MPVMEAPNRPARTLVENGSQKSVDSAPRMSMRRTSSTTPRWLPLVASVGVHGVALTVMALAIGAAVATEEPTLQARNVAFVDTAAEELPPLEADLMPADEAVDTV